jgi:putative transposase
MEISERSVSGITRRNSPKPPSQTWKTFIENHMPDMVAVDFPVVPIIRFKMLFVFVILSHDHRKVIHFNVTENPSALWTAQQIIEAFPWDGAAEVGPPRWGRRGGAPQWVGCREYKYQ